VSAPSVSTKHNYWQSCRSTTRVHDVDGDNINVQRRETSHPICVLHAIHVLHCCCISILPRSKGWETKKTKRRQLSLPRRSVVSEVSALQCIIYYYNVYYGPPTSLSIRRVSCSVDCYIISSGRKFVPARRVRAEGGWTVKSVYCIHIYPRTGHMGCSGGTLSVRRRQSLFSSLSFSTGKKNSVCAISRRRVSSLVIIIICVSSPCETLYTIRMWTVYNISKAPALLYNKLSY